jgi:hypothetical protein
MCRLDLSDGKLFLTVIILQPHGLLIAEMVSYLTIDNADGDGKSAHGAHVRMQIVVVQS